MNGPVQNARVIEIYIDDDNSCEEQHETLRNIVHRMYVEDRLQRNRARIAARQRRIQSLDRDFSVDSDTDDQVVPH